MRNNLKVLLSLLLLGLGVTSGWALPARDVQVIEGKEYFTKVHSLLSKASKSIYIMMYSFKRYPDYPRSPSNIFIQDLAKAKKRGVKVTVLLDISDFNEENSRGNQKTGQLLSSKGVKVYYDSLKTNTHAKVLVVDSRRTVVGSTNWTYHALTDNNEAAVLIDSEEVAGEMEEYIKELVADSQD